MSLPPKAAAEPAASAWTAEHSRLLTAVGIALILLGAILIYGQTLRVPPLDYEDSFYLVHSPYVRVTPAFFRFDAVWTEPYFANFHPVTTITWLFDRAMADKNQLFDGLPFRVTHLLYAVIGASLLIPLFRRLGIPALLAVLGALVYAVHPIHTEVLAWLSARKDLTSLIFILLSFLAWLWARSAATPNQWRTRHGLTVILVLLAVLSKPVAVILPVLFIAYEFCSQSHSTILAWRWSERSRHPLLTRALALSATFLIAGGVAAAIFRNLLLRDPMHGGWLIFVPILLLLPTLAVAPSASELQASREGTASGFRVLAPPFVVLSVVFGAGSAWTFWAQGQIGAIKGGLTLLPTLNLTFDALLAYIGKAFVPARMTASYYWSEYPYISFNGLLGAVVICAALWIAFRIAGSSDRYLRLIAFGIFWFLIALLPVSNLVPTSTKMADRYLFIPTVGSILVLLALAARFHSASRNSRLAACSVLAVIVTGYAAWSYSRTAVWCGTTTPWNGRPQPDLSLWAAAVETNPDDILALKNLALAYLRLTPPQAEKALDSLNRALQLGEANQSKIAGDKHFDLTPVYEALGDGYFTRASQQAAGAPNSEAWQRKKDAYGNAVRYFRLASDTPSGFASADARLFSRLAESCEGRAQMDAQEILTAPHEQRDALIRERDELRRESDEAMRHAKDLLVSARVSPIDPNYRQVYIQQGNLIFNRELGASENEKAVLYTEALRLYREAAAALPDDPRPLLYEGLCYQRLTGITKSPDEKRRQFALGEAALRKAVALPIDAPDYSPSLPYRALASLYVNMGDYRSALDSLKLARQADPASADAAQIDADIRNLEQFLANQHAPR